ncbi:hypothetical protein SAMN05216174_107104 [Actinokineospora iranica]|uniref:Uncharacterized protein n=1 Tax=Actinokineospora iranica TaxID=1271860 RepID=A0A1G6S0E8_9PSEU|nr:hypothetical protein SAMN05216174_107104 [Actinokineospora iranica]
MVADAAVTAEWLGTPEEGRVEGVDIGQESGPQALAQPEGRCDGVHPVAQHTPELVRRPEWAGHVSLSTTHGPTGAVAAPRVAGKSWSGPKALSLAQPPDQALLRDIQG